MIRFQFNEAKATQAAALLLKENGGKMNYMKLIKLLYLADREALAKWERPITGDNYFSMDNGPILSRVLDKINSGRNPHAVKSYWHKHISSPEGYNVKLLKHEPGYDELSQREKELLIDIFEKYESYDQWQMVDICHNILSEWHDPKGTSIPIWIEDILKAVNKTDREIAIINNEITNLYYVKTVLSAE
jgi:uncharacterized phage-associated protein